jgi:flagella basal body P-ring formation protein FlgA
MNALLLVLAAFPTPLQESLTANAPAGARVELVNWSAPACTAKRFEAQPFESSGRVAVRVVGSTCSTWGWATVLLFSTHAVLTRDVEPGESIDSALRFEERAFRRGAPSVTRVAGAVAARKLRAGTTLRDLDLRYGPPPGTPVTVRIQINAISVEQRGTVVPCHQGLCASLPSGKRVSGTFQDGVLLTSGERTP